MEFRARASGPYKALIGAFREQPSPNPNPQHPKALKP